MGGNWKVFWKEYLLLHLPNLEFPDGQLRTQIYEYLPLYFCTTLTQLFHKLSTNLIQLWHTFTLYHHCVKYLVISTIPYVSQFWFRRQVLTIVFIHFRSSIGPGVLCAPPVVANGSRAGHCFHLLLSFLFLCLLLFTHFRETPEGENLFPPIFWHN